MRISNERREQKDATANNYGRRWSKEESRLWNPDLKSQGRFPNARPLKNVTSECGRSSSIHIRHSKQARRQKASTTGRVEINIEMDERGGVDDTYSNKVIENSPCK